MRIRDYVSSKLNEVEHTKYWQPWQLRNYVISGSEVCDNIRWCELRDVKHATGVSKIWHIIDNSTVRAEIRQYIINHLGVNIENIDTDIRIPVGDFNNWQGTGHFREGVWVKFNPSMNPHRATAHRGIIPVPPQRWDIYNIGYNYREPDLEGGNYILTEIASILDIIPQITSYQSSNSSYATQNSQKSQEVTRKNQEVYQKNQEIAQKNREITEVQQKIAGLQAQESSLQSQVNSFQIGDTIKVLNAKQKAHTLQKIWGNNDADSATVINAIKQYGFDPHYIHKNGQSLVQLAISRNDMALFDLLIANKIDFNDCIADLPNFQLVLTSGNNNFISKMLATGQDFSKSVLNAVLRDDAAMLAKMFSYKADLSQISYSGYSLLQLALAAIKPQNKY